MNLTGIKALLLEIQEINFHLRTWFGDLENTMVDQYITHSKEYDKSK